MPAPLPRKIPTVKPKANLPKGHDLDYIFGTKKPRQVPNLQGQGMVDADTIQMVIEAMRTNPNGVRMQYLNLSEPQKMQIALKLAEKFPPVRQGDFLSPTGQEIFDFLSDGTGVAGSPERMKVLADDYIASMADGPVTLNRSPVADIDPDSGVRDGIDISTDLGPAEEGGIIDATKPENPQNPNASARDNAAAAGVFKSKQQTAPSMRGPEMDQQVLPNGQPVATPIPGTTVPSTSVKGMQAPFVTGPDGTPVPTWEKGRKFAEGAIADNISPDKPLGQRGITADQVAAGDSKTYRNSFNEIINSMINNSANPNALSGNKMDSLMALLAKSPTANPKLQFASVDDFVDAIAGNIDVAALNNTKNPSRIGENLPASQKARINLDQVKDMLRRQAVQRYGGSGWGAEKATDLSQKAPAELEPEVNSDLDNLDTAGEIELGPVTPDEANLFSDTPANTVRPQTRGGDMKYIKDENGRIIDTDGEYGPLRERAKDDFTRDAKISNTEADAKVKQEAADDLVDEMLANGADPDEIEAALIEQGLDQESIEAFKQDQLRRIDQYGLEAHQGGKATGNSAKKPGPPISVRGAKEKKIGAEGPLPPPPPKKDTGSIKGGRDFVQSKNKGKPTPSQQEAIDDIVKNTPEEDVNPQDVESTPESKPESTPESKPETKPDPKPEETGDLDGKSDSDPIDNNDSAATDVDDAPDKTRQEPTREEAEQAAQDAWGPTTKQAKKDTKAKKKEAKQQKKQAKQDKKAAEQKKKDAEKAAVEAEKKAAQDWKKSRKQAKKDAKADDGKGGKNKKDGKSSTARKVGKGLLYTGVGGGLLIGTLAALNRRGGKEVGDANGLRNGRGDGEVGVTDDANGLNPNVDDGKKGRLTDAERGDILRRLRSSRGVNKNTQTNKRWTR